MESPPCLSRQIAVDLDRATAGFATLSRIGSAPRSRPTPVAPRRDSFTLLRERTRWRIALVLCLVEIAALVLLGLLNARIGRPESVVLAAVVLGCLGVVLALLLLLPKPLGGRIYFWFTIALLAYLPLFGWQHSRSFHYWSYILPPVLFFVLRWRPALAGSLACGAWSAALLAPFTPPIDVARIAVSYLLLTGFITTFAVLEESAAAMLRYHSDHDPLTNCFNRRTFNETLEGIDQAAEEGNSAAPCAFLLIDIDHFKAINDSHGHLVGDRAITQVAAALNRALDADTRLYRYGGEEFAVVVPLPPADQGSPGADSPVLELAERLRAAVAAESLGEAKATVSVGVATWAPGQGSVAAALDRADAALYAAKRRGRNRVESAAALASPAGPERRRRHSEA